MKVLDPFLTNYFCLDYSSFGSLLFLAHLRVAEPRAKLVPTDNDAISEAQR